MKSVSCDGVQFAGTASAGGAASGSVSVVHGWTPGLPCVLTGKPAAAIAAGLVEVWSTIRLLMTRGSVSKTLPEVWLYDVGPPPPNAAGTGPATRNTGVVRRGKSSSAAPILALPGTRLLQEPSTVRSPKESSGLA